jgi:hypothetical protein
MSSSSPDGATYLVSHLVGLSPPEQGVFKRAWNLAETARSQDELLALAFPADSEKVTTDRHHFGDASTAGELVALIGIVWAATQQLITLSKRFVDGQPLGNANDELLKLLQDSGINEDRAQEVTSQLGAALADLAKRRAGEE